jgi:hypothetical protein
MITFSPSRWASREQRVEVGIAAEQRVDAQVVG